MNASKKNWTVGKQSIPDGFQAGCAVAVSDDEIWLIGGTEPKQLKRILPFFTNNHTFANYSKIPTLLKGRHGHKCSLLPDKSGVMVTGGGSNSTEIIDLKTRKSNFSGDMIESRFLHGIGTLIINKVPTLVVFGGSYWTAEAPTYLNTFEMYNQTTNKWNIWHGAKLNQTKRDFGFATLKPSISSRLCKKPKN